MTLSSTNYIYFNILIEGITILVNLIPIQNSFIDVGIEVFSILYACYIYSSAFATQRIALINRDGDENFEGKKLPDVV